MSTSPRGSRRISRTSERLRELAPEHILPQPRRPGGHRCGGYGPDLIGATEQYRLRALQRCRTDTGLRDASLRRADRRVPARGAVTYFAPYEAVHRANVETVLADA